MLCQRLKEDWSKVSRCLRMMGLGIETGICCYIDNQKIAGHALAHYMPPRY